MPSSLLRDTNFPLRILIVEDHAIQRMVLRLLLQQSGVSHIDEAEDGYQALSRLESACYDLMICDLDMPRLDGIQLMRHMRSLEHVPLLVYCSAQAEDILHSVSRFGFHHELSVLGCLQKPVSLAQLKPLLHACVKQLDGRWQTLSGSPHAFSRQELRDALRSGQILPWY